uniref:RING-type E3 ubiquitin transferase n=2 Tax=Mesocestoides corti TaxID=53468 RepID=A0A5K3F1A6_MESCO
MRRNGVAAVALVFVATTFMVINAYYQKKQFYSTVVYLTKHKLFFAAIILQCFTILLLIAKAITWIFFGTIQQTELDNVLSRIWYTSFDMCLLFAFFQDEINTKFVFMFTLILFMKSFHWLLEGRVDHMERTPVIRTSFHVRTISFMVLLASIDILHIAFFFWGVSSQEVASLAVGAEYYILLFELISTVMRYILQTINSMRDTPWDQKSMYLLYVDVVVGLLRLFFYLEFAPTLWRHHPFPLFIIRPIYLNLRFLKKTVRDLFMSRRAIRLMNTVFQDVTATELAASNDAVCIICREEMQTQTDPPAEIPPGTIKRLPCGHIFHAACLRTWFQRQQTCPTCRLNVLRRHTAAQRGQGNRERVALSGQNQEAPNQRGAGGTQIRIGIQRTPRRQATGTSGQQMHTYPTNLVTFLQQNAVIPGGSQPNQVAGSVAPPFSTPPIIIPGNQFLPGLVSPTPAQPVELAQVEATERELRTSIEARVATLQQIRLLLDAVILQMNAYVAATANLPPAAPAAVSEPPHSQKPPSSPPQPSGLGDGESDCGRQSPKNGNSESSSIGKLPSSRETTPGDDEPKTEKDELTVLRQRRLEKLSKETADSSSKSPGVGAETS